MSTIPPPAEGAAPGGPSRDASTGELVQRLTTQVSELVRSEFALATAELKNKGTKAGVGIGTAGAGGVLALYGGGALVAATVLGLATALDAWLAALVVGVVLLAVAGVLAALGIGKVKQAGSPVPEQALDSTRRDVATVKKSLHR